MTQYGYALVGLTAAVAMIVGVLTFALLRVAAGVRDTRRHLGSSAAAETAFLTSALQEAVGKLKAQEQAMGARAVASERLNGQIVESLTAGLLVVDERGLVRILNPAGRRLLQVSNDPVGQDLHTVLAEASPLIAVIDECVAGGAAVVRRSVAMPPALRATHVGVTVSPLETSGERGGVICLFADLTAVRDLEEQLRTKETLARLGELTAGIAHEFRNGLATIHGYSRLIDFHELPVRYRPYVDAIRQETELLGSVVTNFLNFARPEQVTLTPVNLGVVARLAADDLRNDLPTATVVSFQGDFGTIRGDEVLLRQVFSNLIRNAAEAADGAGIAPGIVVSGRIDGTGTKCLVFVDDNGPGVPADVRENVFKPFFTTRSRGTGLGLAIVQKVVLILDGRVTVTAGPEGGARFQLIFPRLLANGDDSATRSNLA